ncbi:hypothetical protein [Aequorivita marina]|uniref:hypothetical protein n=1 Tax=Aequorivita marina TaxID=3073654 RepID=UPI002875147A|nr:hypothetical protein [Aequorivita sp. S2608]MDS1297136.1 hypothetical protein [Aequorivita sp. S2608]
MKAIYFLLPLFMINACKTQTGPTTASENTKMEQVENKKSGCPDDGTCSVEVHQNKTLIVKDDGTGSFYPDFEEGNNTIIAYTYHKPGPKGVADADYSETIHFEIPAGVENFKKSDASLSDVNLLYGRHCFCRDGGYFPVTKGKLVVEKTENGIMFDLKFDTGKTTQVISHIRETAKM